MSEKIYLRALEPDDYQVSIAWRRDEQIWSQVVGPKYWVSEAYEKKWVQDAIFGRDKIVLAVCLCENDKYIGNAYATDLDTINRSCSSSILMGDKSEWGKGYGTQAMDLLTHYLFDERAMHRVEVRILADNRASIRMCEKCGYQHEGTLRQAVFKNGEYKDLVVMGIVNERH